MTQSISISPFEKEGQNIVEYTETIRMKIITVNDLVCTTSISGACVLFSIFAMSLKVMGYVSIINADEMYTCIVGLHVPGKI